MMKKIILIICVTFLPIAGRAQINLVQNPSFEQYSTCPDFVDEAKYCSHWVSLDTVWSPPDWVHSIFGVPEYCNTCASSFHASVPINGRFGHHPKTGNGLMEIQMFCNQGDTFSNARDYLQQHLQHTLASGHLYSVVFYTTLAQGGNFAINKIGAYFDNGAIDTTHHPGWVQSQYTPQIIDTNIVNDTLNWVKITDTFTATGTEEFITIGNFSGLANTDTLVLKPFSAAATVAAWYLIDDVSVIDCSNIPNAGRDTLITIGDSIFIGTHELLLPYTWYVAGNTTPIDSGGGFWAHPTTATTYVLEQNLCGIKKWDTVKVWVAPLSVGSQQWAVGSLRVYPNPVTDEITIEHAANCEVAFYDVTGRKVASFVSMTNKEVLDISTLPSGVYLVQVTDESTGARAVKTMLKE